MKRLTINQILRQASHNAGSQFGASMGRSDSDAETMLAGVCFLDRMGWYDDCYDAGGAYWGGNVNGCGDMYCAHNEEGGMAFTRATDRYFAALAFEEKFEGIKWTRRPASTDFVKVYPGNDTEIQFGSHTLKQMPRSGAGDGAACTIVKQFRSEFEKIPEELAYKIANTYTDGDTVKTYDDALMIIAYHAVMDALESESQDNWGTVSAY